MYYSWLCEDGHETEVERKLADIDVAPERCSACTKVPNKRIILVNKSGVKGFILEGSGWHNDNYSKYRSIK